MGSAEPGTLYGIGVGPGDARLMTLRAAGLIRTVDTISYFAKAGNESNARKVAAPLIAPGRKELPLYYPLRRSFPSQIQDMQAKFAASMPRRRLRSPSA